MREIINQTIVLALGRFRKGLALTWGWLLRRLIRTQANAHRWGADVIRHVGSILLADLVIYLLTGHWLGLHTMATT